MSITGIKGLNRALRALPREAVGELRDASQESATVIAQRAAARAMSQGGVYRLVAPSIRARRDRVPVIRIGGSKMLPRRRRGEIRTARRIGDVMWGAEFGGQGRATTMQFRPHLGRTGYALWPVIREELDATMERWSDALYQAAVSSARKGR